MPAPAGLLASALVSQGVWLGIAWGAASLRAGGRGEALGLGRSTWSAGRLSLWVLGFCALSGGLSVLIHRMGAGGTGSLAAIDSLLAGAGAAWAVPAVLALGIAPAIGEELLFRGWLQGVLLRRYPAGVAVLLSSVAFGIAHFDRVHSAAAVILGLYLGSLALLTGSVRTAIAAHAANNVLAVLWGTLSDGPLWVAGIGWAAGTGALVLWASTSSHQVVPKSPEIKESSEPPTSSG